MNVYKNVCKFPIGVVSAGGQVGVCDIFESEENDEIRRLLKESKIILVEEKATQKEAKKEKKSRKKATKNKPEIKNGLDEENLIDDEETSLDEEDE